jgi:hypothetical protein
MTTDTRQLRLLIEGVLSAHGINDLEYPELSFRMTSAVKKFIDDNNGTPTRTREQILADIERAVGKSFIVGNRKQDIFDEINRRVGIRAVGTDWERFIDFCLVEEKNGKTISKFLDWWLGDTWQAEHPPTRPDGWRVKWDLAFVKTEPEPEPAAQPEPDESQYVPNPYAHARHK